MSYIIVIFFVIAATVTAVGCVSMFNQLFINKNKNK